MIVVIDRKKLVRDKLREDDHQDEAAEFVAEQVENTDWEAEARAYYEARG